ncbi:MAG: triose-phosphate isomerase [Candidatus Bipolaricaulia bacterium]
MRRRLIAGNWKMHMTPQETEAFISSFLDRIPGERDAGSAEALLVPPYTNLDRAASLLEGTGVELGAQDLYYEEQGAYTGAVSGGMIRACGCRYVLVGHSERRHVFGDDDETVARKLGAALASGLLPILCVGEVLEERRSGRTEDVVFSQLRSALQDVGSEEATRIVVAYEPVWAIGTGETATPDQAQDAIASIRRRLSERFDTVLAERARILYGGSITPENAASLVSESDIDGALVGGASLDPESFARILAAANGQ